MKTKVVLGITLACLLFCLGGLVMNGTSDAKASPVQMTKRLPFSFGPGDKLNIMTASAFRSIIAIEVEKSTAGWIKAVDGAWINIDNIVTVDKLVTARNADSAKLNILPRLAESKQDVAKTNIKSLVSAVESYRMDHNLQLPVSLKELFKPSENNMNKPYLKNEEVLYDPWGNPYVYIVKANDFHIKSLGADGKEGGDSDNADISSKNRYKEKWGR